MNRPSVAHFAWSVVLSTVLTGCAYRFTNAHVSPPPGVRSIAVEAVYDTSREVLPHELLWESLQSAFATDGHLRVTPQSRADALVIAHIKQASIDATGTYVYPDIRNGSDQVKDPNPFNHQAPPAPQDFRVLTQTGQYRDKGQLTLVCEVQIIDLNTHAVLLRKAYPMSGQFQAVHSTAIPSSSVANDHLRYDESARADFKALADGIASGVVRDLLVR